MKKGFFYTAFVTFLITGVLFSGIEARGKFRLSKANSAKRKFLNSHVLQNRQADSWDYINLEILVAPEYFVEPPYDPTLAFKLFSGWSVYDGWLSHTVTYETEYLDLYQIDSHGNITHMTEQEWDEIGQEWITSYRTVYTYESNTTLVKVLQQDWYEEHRTWLDAYKSDYSYSDPNGQADAMAGYVWDEMSDTWEDASKSNYTYDSNNRLTGIEEYDYEDLTWIGWFKSNYTYGSDGNISETIVQIWDYNQEEWEYDFKLTYVYNSDNLPTEMYDLIWDDGSQEWINGFHSIITYSNKLWSSWIEEEWDESSSSWINYLEDSYYYNAKGDMDSSVTKYWDDAAEGWESGEKISVLYNAKGNPATIKYYEWDPATSEWIYYTEDMTFKYNYTSAIQQKQTLSSHNSALQITRKKGTLVAKLKGRSGAHDGMCIYDLQGRLVHSAKPVTRGNEIVYTWNTAAHKVYILSIRYNGETLTERVLID